MLETKDYWTLAASGTAICLSIFSLTVAFLSYRLAARRDQRDLDAKRPLVEIEPPACDGLGPWVFPVKITNRDEAPIQVERFISDENRNIVMTFSKNYPVSLADFVEPNALNYATLQVRLPVGEMIDFTVEVQPHRGRRVQSEAEAVFALEYRRTLGDADRRRVCIRTVLNT